MIRVNDLHYTYARARNKTLHGLNFEIAEGEIFGFLGPSGAGKTTTQNILIGLLRHYEGSVRIMDKEVREWDKALYRIIGVSFELPNHYLQLTALENLAYFASLYGLKTRDPQTLLELVGLGADAKKKVSEFSKGMKVRLNVARSLLHNPRILFLDEPIAGLDPVNARTIKNIIRDLRSRGSTVFITTHNMVLADELCDRVAFITDGTIRVIDAPANLKKQYGTRLVRVEYVGHAGALEAREFPLDALAEEPFLSFVQSVKRIETMHSKETTLDDVFISVTGETLLHA